jgi:endo-1,4-beta-xylanase
MDNVSAVLRRPARRCRRLVSGAVAGLLAASALMWSGTPAQASTATGSGTHEGWFYSHWSDGAGDVTMTLGSDGNYGYRWSGVGHFIGGKGWQTGGRRAVNYSGAFNPRGNAYLALYGWTTNPLAEYYVVENFGTYNPSSGATLMGTVNSDGGSYRIYRILRRNFPSINGPATFYQYLSVRTSKRSSGTITTGNHFDAWAEAGMNLGTHNYMIMATEGYQSSGTSDITVSEGSQPTTTQPTTTTSSSSSTGGGSESCSATLRVTGSWTGGWQGEVTVKAGSSAVSGWSLNWSFPSGTAITQAWNATIAGATNVTARNVDWNGSLGAGASTSFGFIGSGTPATPSVSCSG